MNESKAHHRIPKEVQMEIVNKAIETNTLCPHLHAYITDFVCREKYECHFSVAINWPTKESEEYGIKQMVEEGLDDKYVKLYEKRLKQDPRYEVIFKKMSPYDKWGELSRLLDLDMEQSYTQSLKKQIRLFSILALLNCLAVAVFCIMRFV